jgi:hypothetical protein
MRFSDLDGVFRFFEIGACYHELLAPNIQSPLEHIFEVIVVSFRAMVFPSENGIP